MEPLAIDFTFLYLHPAAQLLGRPCCGLSIWLSLLDIFNILFYASFFFFFFFFSDMKTDKSAIFVWYENGRRRLLGAQSINRQLGTGTRERTYCFTTPKNLPSSGYIIIFVIKSLYLLCACVCVCVCECECAHARVEMCVEITSIAA